MRSSCCGCRRRADEAFSTTARLSKENLKLNFKMLGTKIFFLELLLTLTSAQAQVSAGDATAVASAANKMASQLIAFYTTSPGSDGQGAVAQSSASDASGIQWYESGIYWGGILEYSKVYNDQQFGSTIASALGLASGSTGSFLGSNSILAATLLGKWNDDIMWWALATMNAAELYGKDAKLPTGIAYLQVAKNTYDEAWQQWDTAQCKGGIYWSRDRTGKSKGYKSVITNAQHIMLGSRLYLMTQNQTYLTNANLVYSWLKASGLVTSTWHVLDGVNGDAGCVAGGSEFSYNSGMLIGAIGWLHKASNQATLLQDGSQLLSVFASTFVQNNVVTDRNYNLITACEPNCKLNEVQAKGTGIRGLAYCTLTLTLDAALTTNTQDKATIQNILKTSTQAMLATCDSSYNCGINVLTS
jgi:mannan endo-1,6-alpha-mannosidase